MFDQQSSSHAPGSPAPVVPSKARQDVDTVTIRFAGDSGDGMQLTGSEFSKATAVAGNALQTFPDYPSEIRAPTGTVAGVSGYQIQFSNASVFTSGDAPDVLVAMNPAALKANLAELRLGGILIVNLGAFTEQNLLKAGYSKNPLEDGSLHKYQTHPIDITRLTEVALASSGLTTKEISRAKNMFALGVMLWLYSRPTEPIIQGLERKFAAKPHLAVGNTLALKAGFAYGESTEIFTSSYQVRPAPIAPGLYRSVSGNEATAYGLLAAQVLSGLPGFLGSYPITPATDILHELAKHKNFDFITFQAEDEIAGICSAIGASYAGLLAVTTTSGPGMALKGEALGLAVMTELPLVIVNVQRGGPSTGLPTKTEQADLFQAMFGRNGESPMPVIAASSPSDCFDAAIEACRIAIKHMTPVVLLTDGYIGNGQEPWKVPDIASLEKIPVSFRTDPNGYSPYMRDPQTLARPWVRPGTPGLEHRIGGLEKDFATGNVSTNPANHEKMSQIRADKVARVAADFPKIKIQGADQGDVLVIGWGSTFGAITQAVEKLQSQGKKVSAVHLRHLNPLPNDLGEVLGRFKKIVVPELNMGQLSWFLRAKYLVDAISINKMQGRPFAVTELVSKIEEVLS